MADVRLTDQQVQQYHEDGFLFVKELFDADEVDLLHRIAKQDRKLAEAGAMPDAAGGQSKIWLDTQDRRDIYNAYVHSPRIAEPMRQLIGRPIYHWHHKMMLKEPKIGGAWEWHQDYGYWYHDKCLFPWMASCMIAVDQATKDNGCLQVLRGSHHLGRIEHGRSGGQTGADLERVEAAQQRLDLVYCEMEPGTACFFHCNTLHRSDQNRSDRSRWSLICCYNALDNVPYAGKGHGEAIELEVWDDHAIRQIGQDQLAARKPT